LKQAPHRGLNLVSTEGEEEEEDEEGKYLKKMQFAYIKTQNNPPTLISYFVVFQAAL
jgi:hypothetical protein